MAARHSKKHGRHKARHAVPSSKPAIIKSMFVPKDRFYTAVMQGVHDSMERERKRTRQAMHTVLDGGERAHRCERTSWSEYPPVNKPSSI